MLTVNWILDFMESIAGIFKYCDRANELWGSIESAYVKKRNNARILELSKEIIAFK